MTTNYTVQIAKQTETQTTAYVTNGDGKTYGVTMSRDLVCCSCPDAMYRQHVCKHARMVVEHLMSTLRDAIRTQEEAAVAVEQARAAWSKAASWVTMNGPALVPAKKEQAA